LRQLVAGIEGDARYGNRGHPVDDWVAKSFLCEGPLPWTGIGTPKADERPAVVRSGHEDVDLIAAVRSPRRVDVGSIFYRSLETPRLACRGTLLQSQRVRLGPCT